MMSRSRTIAPCATALAAVLGAAPGFAEETDKRGHTLLRPTPRELRRPMSTDRPDTTESPFSLDAGAVQIEASFVDWARDSSGDGNTVETLTIADMNVKVGLRHNADLQLVFSPYLRESSRADGRGRSRTEAGPSDVTVRLKLNVWGNEGGRTALGILPFVTFPTGPGSDPGDVDAGLAVPFARDLSERVGLGLMAELDALRDDGGDYELALLHTAVVGFEIRGALGAYAEYVGNAHIDGGAYEASASVGFTYSLGDDLSLDGGAVLGLSDAAADATVFTGVAVRF